MFEIDNLPHELLLGRQTENGVTVISIDVQSWLDQWPGMEIVIMATRPGESAAYPAATRMDGNSIVWTVNGADTAIAGRGTAEILGLVDGVRKLSQIVRTRIKASTVAATMEPPEGAQPWVDTVINAADEIKNMTATAETLQPGEAATTSYADGKLTLGIPRGLPGAKGDKGDTGPKGDPGSDASVTAENIQSALGYVPVKDVQVAGNSVLDGGVAKVPIAQINEPGVVSVLAPVDSGIWNDNGSLKISYATDAEISTRLGYRKTIVCSNLDKAVKAAMCDGKGAAWTDAEQAAARSRMGLDKSYELIEEITVGEDDVTLVERDVDITRLYLMITGVSGHTGTCALETSFDSGHSFSAYWGLAQIAAQYEVVVEHGTANGYYKYSTTSVSSTPSLMGINLLAMKTIFSATTKPSQITKLKISGPIPKGTNLKIYGVRA